MRLQCQKDFEDTSVSHLSKNKCPVGPYLKHVLHVIADRWASGFTPPHPCVQFRKPPVASEVGVAFNRLSRASVRQVTIFFPSRKIFFQAKLWRVLTTWPLSQRGRNGNPCNSFYLTYTTVKVLPSTHPRETVTHKELSGSSPSVIGFGNCQGLHNRKLSGLLLPANFPSDSFPGVLNWYYVSFTCKCCIFFEVWFM